MAAARVACLGEVAHAAREGHFVEAAEVAATAAAGEVATVPAVEAGEAE